jgi:hypothetical protein
MGEIAEMMLEGELCECCGEYLGEATGHPGYCSAKCARDRGASPAQVRCDKPRMLPGPIGKKLIKTLKQLVIMGQDDGPLTPATGQSMYAGMPWDMACAQYAKLEKRGFVERRSPHNPIHKDRAVITQAGLDFLRSIDKI